MLGLTARGSLVAILVVVLVVGIVAAAVYFRRLYDRNRK